MEYGYYALSLPAGDHKVWISYLGFSDKVVEITLDKNKKLDILLDEATEQLEEVVVSQNSELLNVRKPQMSVNVLNTKTIKQIPAVLGEADIVKSIVLLPGVSNAGEGSSGFNVRGGAVDQNLILLDEATIYNSSHLFGLFSIFNPDAIKDLKLYKGGIPSRYGGRVSSVLEIYQKEGNSKEFKGNGGIGAVASRLLLEGPIANEKSSFLIGGRASYAHLFLKATGNDNSAYFYDLNTKLNFELNPQNTIYLSGYFGRDVFNISESFINSYGNSFVNMRWNHLFSEKLFSNLSLIYSDYYYGLELDFVGFEWNSGIKNFNAKYDFKYYLSNKLQMQFGVNNHYYLFNPGEIKPNRDDSGITYKKLTDKFANEASVYIDIEQQLGDHLSISYGTRLSQFNRFGQKEIYNYANNHAVVYNQSLQQYQSATPTDTIAISNKKTTHKFSNLEPRLAISYALNDNTSIKASYNRMTQYLHLISNTSSPTPLDVWTPSDNFAKPQLLDQFAVGYFKNIGRNYTIETELFYKKIKNRIDYIDGAELIANNAIEQVILPGKARAYGWELLLKKNMGNLTGWIAYTLSKSEQRTPGRNSNEPGINNGQWYNTPYDKTHDVSVTANYKHSEKWTFGGNFIFQTGQPTTYPIGQYTFHGMTIPIYGPRNDNRLPSYHRLDLSATLTPKKNATRNWDAEWIFTIYNVYNRKNANSISFRENRDLNRNEAVKLSLFGIIPAVSYNFKF